MDLNGWWCHVLILISTWHDQPLHSLGNSLVPVNPIHLFLIGLGKFTGNPIGNPKFHQFVCCGPVFLADPWAGGTVIGGASKSVTGLLHLCGRNLAEQKSLSQPSTKRGNGKST